MKRPLALALALALLASMLAGACFVNLSKANFFPEGTPSGIEIGSGSILGTSSISKSGKVYTFTGDVVGNLVILADDVVVDGAGYTLKGYGVGAGIFLQERDGVKIKNLNIVNFEYGVKFTWLNYGGTGGPAKVTTVSNNTIANNTCGIIVNDFSAANVFSDNRVENNVYGVQLYSFAQPSGNVFRNNAFINNNYSISDGSDKFNDMDTSNTVNGKPVYYWIDKHDTAVPSNAGCVVLKNCSGIAVQNLRLSNNGQAVLLCGTTGSTVTGNVLTGNAEGITLRGSSNNEISGNTISDSGDYGIMLYHASNDNVVSGNSIVRAGRDGVHVEYGCTGNAIIGNQISSSQGCGMCLSSFQNFVIAENNITLCKFCGIRLQFASNQSMVRGNYLTQNALGILVETSGITITENTLIENDGWAIRLNSSQQDNFIHHNNFINNHVSEGLQVSMPATWIFDPPGSTTHDGPTLAAGKANSWDDGSEGNYWSDYASRYPNASASGNTGVGDTAYFINENNIDRYPLMSPYGAVDAVGASVDSPTPSQEPTPTLNPQAEPEPLPIALIAAASGVAIALIGVIALVYFKRRVR